MQQLIITGEDKKVQKLFGMVELTLRRWGLEVEWKSLAPANAIKGAESNAKPEQGNAPSQEKSASSSGQNANPGEETEAAAEAEAAAAEAEAEAEAEAAAKAEAEETKSSVNVTGKPERDTKQDKKADNLKKK